jgi:hypothetical protein
MRPVRWPVTGRSPRGGGKEAAVLPLLPACRQPALQAAVFSAGLFYWRMYANAQPVAT